MVIDTKQIFEVEKYKIRRRRWMGLCFREKKTRITKIITEDYRVVGFKISFTKNMSNQWFTSIMLGSNNYSSVLVYFSEHEKAQKTQ